MPRNHEGYYQIFKSENHPGRDDEIVDEVRGLDQAQMLIERLMRERSADHQHVAYYRSSYPTSRRTLPRRKKQ